MIIYEEFRHFGPENFQHLIEIPSNRTKTTVRKDQFDRTIETTIFYRGSKILGKMVRDMTGRRFYFRKDRMVQERLDFKLEKVMKKR